MRFIFGKVVYRFNEMHYVGTHIVASLNWKRKICMTEWKSIKGLLIMKWNKKVSTESLCYESMDHIGRFLCVNNIESFSIDIAGHCFFKCFTEHQTKFKLLSFSSCWGPKIELTLIDAHLSPHCLFIDRKFIYIKNKKKSS